MRVEAIAVAEPIRFVVVHYHIFKNGGSTIEFILEREFHGRFASLHGPTLNAALNERHLAAFLEQNGNISALTSHHLCYPKPAIPGIVLFDCCFVRHPLERVHSIYTYLRKTLSDDPLGRLARRHSPGDFVKVLLDQSPHIVSDVQVHRLANRGSFTRLANQADLERATQVLADMAIPGVVDQFDESLVAAEYFLNPAFPGIRMEYARQNVSNPSEPESSGPEAHADKWIRLWGISAYEDIARLNEFDTELHRRARKEIERRLSHVPKSKERLAEFRFRCAAERSGYRRAYA